MNRIIMLFFAAAAVLGGLDCIVGNRKGYGERFEEAFRLLGPTALSMAGMICLSPALSLLLERLLAPALRLLGTDPALAGGFFAIDMGGYPLAVQLSDLPEWGGYFGIIVAAVFGCTLTFTLPVGIGVIEEKDSGYSVTGIASATDTDIVIPSQYNGLPVIDIDLWAFHNCSSLRSVEIPAPVRPSSGNPPCP